MKCLTKTEAHDPLTLIYLYSLSQRGHKTVDIDQNGGEEIG